MNTMKIYGGGVASVWESTVTTKMMQSTSAMLARQTTHEEANTNCTVPAVAGRKPVPQPVLTDKSAIIEMVYRNSDYKNISRQISGGDQLGDDLYHDMIERLLKYDDEKIIGLYQRDELRWFITRIMMTMWRCRSNPFFQAHRKITETITDRTLFPEEPYDMDGDLRTQLIIDTTDQVLNEKLNSGNRNDWYEAALWKVYIETGSFRKAQEKTHIPYKTISNTVRRMKLIIAKRIELQANGSKVI